MLFIAYIDHPCGVTLFEVKQHGGLVEEGQHCHVLNHVELWRILLQNLRVFVGHSLRQRDDYLILVSRSLTFQLDFFFFSF